MLQPKRHAIKRQDSDTSLVLLMSGTLKERPIDALVQDNSGSPGFQLGVVGSGRNIALPSKAGAVTEVPRSCCGLRERCDAVSVGESG